MKSLYLILISVVLLSCKNNNDKLLIKSAKVATIDSIKGIQEKQRIIDSMKTTMVKEPEKKAVTVINNNTETTVAAPKRKKWSKAAKGAVIGAGVGAISGAIISKKKGEGAIIGGLAGAGIGAGTGAILDSKKN